MERYWLPAVILGLLFLFVAILKYRDYHLFARIRRTLCPACAAPFAVRRADLQLLASVRMVEGTGTVRPVAHVDYSVRCPGCAREFRFSTAGELLGEIAVKEAET